MDKLAYSQTKSFSFSKLITIVEEAGKILLNKFNIRNNVHFRDDSEIFAKEKSEKELLIEEDLISQEIIINGIRSFDKEVKIYSEELDNIDQLFKDGSDKKYIIDPLDGTHNFYYGLPYLGIAVAILDKNNLSKAGIICLPSLDILAVCEGHTSPSYVRINNKWSKIQTTPRKLNQSIICYDNQFYKLGRVAINIYDILAHESFTSRITGSAAADSVMIAIGRINARIWNQTEPYDIAAGMPIVLGAGGKVSNFNGKDVNIFSKDLIMSSDKKLHNKLIQEINRVK